MAANSSTPTPSSARTRKCSARSTAISRSTIWSRSAFPRSGSSISSRVGRVRGVGSVGGGSGDPGVAAQAAVPAHAVASRRRWVVQSGPRHVVNAWPRTPQVIGSQSRRRARGCWVRGQAASRLDSGRRAGLQEGPFAAQGEHARPCGSPRRSGAARRLAVAPAVAPCGDVQPPTARRRASGDSGGDAPDDAPRPDRHRGRYQRERVRRHREPRRAGRAGHRRGAPPCMASELSSRSSAARAPPVTASSASRCSNTGSATLPHVRLSRRPVPRQRPAGALPTDPTRTTQRLLRLPPPSVLLTVAPGPTRLVPARRDPRPGLETPAARPPTGLQVIPPDDTPTLTASIPDGAYRVRRRRPCRRCRPGDLRVSLSA